MMLIPRDKKKNKTLLLLKIQQLKKEVRNNIPKVLVLCYEGCHKNIYKVEIQKREQLTFSKSFRKIFRETVT